MTHTTLEFRTKQELVNKYNGERGDFMRLGVAVLADHEYDVCPAGEVRWKSNGHIVPGDILEMAVVDGTITIEQRNKSEDLRKIEDAELFANYRAMREKYGYSEEEQMEMRAAFLGEDPECVVDIITGKVIDF